MLNQAYQVKLEHIFEGPMDLLVHLIKKNELDIYDIPIAFITEQFLAYIEWMKAMNIDVAADFLVMAASLAQIKSRMLLPQAQPDAEEEDDPRSAITGPLVEYIRIKSAAAQLAERLVLNDDVFVRTPDKTDYATPPEEIPVAADLFELARTYQELIDRASPKIDIRITPDRISVKDRMTEVIDILEEKGTVTFSELMARDTDRSGIVVTFLAVLEIARLHLVRISQNETTGSIRLYAM